MDDIRNEYEKALAKALGQPGLRKPLSKLVRILARDEARRWLSEQTAANDNTPDQSQSEA